MVGPGFILWFIPVILLQVEFTLQQHTLIQLRGGKSRFQGRIEIFHGGKWGTVCDDKFDENDARVVCRMLGLEVMHPVILNTESFGEAGGEIWADDLECTGEERDISGCPFPGFGNNDCTHKEDVSLICDVTKIRLTNGTFVGEGRIEVNHNDKWGTVCDQNFDENDAKVVCRMLGFKDSHPTVYMNGYFGKGSGEVLLTNVDCKGNEVDVKQCNFTAWGHTDCTHSSDVGLSCATPVRLVGAIKPSKGRLEIYHAGAWGSVCDDNLSIKDANVVCRTLGFMASHPAIYPGGLFGHSSLPLRMTDLSCNGSETDISACQYKGWGSHKCLQKDDVGLECQTKIRLANGPTPSRGRVEILYRGEWGTICRDSFGQDEAKVVCRMLGYHNTNYRIQSTAVYHPGTGKIWMDDLSCDGSENDLADCKFSGWGQSNCGHNEDVGVDCDARVSLSGGYNEGQGTIQIYHENQWGAICDDGFDVNAAKVICKMMGHHTLNPTAYSQSHYASRPGPIWMDDVRCTGKESDIGSCTFSGWGKENCGRTEQAGVDCGNAFRLVNGNTELEGRVEVFHNGQWGTICDDHFNEGQAQLICKIMGYERRHPLIYQAAHFGQGSGKIWIDKANCQGNEEDISSCIGRYRQYYRGYELESYSSGGGWWSSSHTSYRAKSVTRLRYVTEWGHHACSHSEDISISCKTQIRLVNGRTETEGRLEVYNNNQWGTVCDNAFNVNSAKVVCRMLGYDTKFAEAFGGASYGEGIGSVMMNNVRCVGNEIDIGDCSFDGWRSGSCSHSKDVGVSCGAKVRLVGGINEAQGRVEIHHNGHWGMICDESFGINEGKVICRMLGFDDSFAKVYLNAHYGNGSTPVAMDGLSCVGTESDVSYCSVEAWDSTNCTNNNNAGVACRIPVRLVGGGSLNEGRLEVRLDEQWGTVCSDGFDVNDARVVCKSLGYDVLEPEITTKFGEGFGRVMMAQLSCSGVEQGLSECGFISGKQYNCGHGNDVGIICRTDVRLINGKSPDEGRIEIKYNNIYGSICSSDFDMVDARVFCSMLGYNNPYPEICNSCFGNSNGSLHLTNVNCTGDELDITKCSSAGWHNANCSSGSDTGVFCKTRVRLYGGDNPSEGRLEVNHNQIWGTVCSDDFDISDAKVICSMLGYNTSNPRIWTQNYTHGSGSAWISKLGCYGTEDDIAACSFPGWGKGGCQSSKYMNIGCGIGVRLTAGLVPNEGRVEVYHEDQWGTICNDGFTVQNAKVICRMLGFETKNVTILPPSHFKPSSLSIMMDDIHCTGMETHIAACNFSGWGQHNCQHSDDVSISCGRTPIRLVNGTRLTSGRLEVYHNNVWGTVCRKNFDTKDATVVCKSLGFDAKYPYVVPTPYFGSGNGLILLENLGCMGNETDISNCSSNGWGHSDCNHDQDVSLLCDTFARLVDGPDSSSGRVELLHNGEWGTLCDDGFDIPDAAVICTMLGYNNTNPHVIYAPHFAYGSGSIFLKNIECAGNESDIEECSHSAWGVTDCKHSEDVGIDCTTDVRLVGGSGPFEGRLEVFHNGEWGTVCDSAFDESDAVVICKMLGYQQSNPAVIPISKIKPGFGPIWMGNLTCSGDEVDIALCKFGGWGHTGHCAHAQDIAMTCGATTEIRLSGGRGKSEGRLEIAYGVTWLPVCESGFTMNSAKVVCRHFGFPVSKNDPSVIQSTDFVNDWPTSAYTVVCTGGELDLALCNITLLANSSCSSGSYVGIRCPKTDIRLISQFLPSSGRVEMYHEGRWGSVCGHSYDSKAAEVMCRMLGFKADGSKFFRNSKFGKSAEQPWIDNVVCSGYENDVTGCRFTWSSRACNDDANIGLECSSTPIRLVNGAGPWEGRVEILNDGQWNTICDDGFNVAEASVICKMLGFKELYTSPRAKLSSLFGASNSAARLGLMSCSGTELDIHACIRGVWGPTTCSSYQEAGVDCRESNLRLTGGSHSMEGRVELLVNGMWSAVCDDDWDNVEATIVCKTLSTFPFDRKVSGKAFRNSFFGHGTGKIAYSSVKCNGTEIDVMHCTLKEVAVPTCDHSNEAGVSCSFAEQIKLSRPVSTTAEGTVFININGDWNTLCDKDFGTEEAQTVCRELGYWSSNVQFFSNSWFGEGNGTSQDLRPQCMGTETKIVFCPLEKSWNEMTCSHADDAGVQCTPTTLDTSNVRLIDGDKPGKGRIEVKYNNHWGSFCWRRWNDQNTKVFCKMLKYSHTEGKSFLAKRNGSAILIGSLRCHGQEDNIGLCKAFMDKETCTDEAVGVDCTGEMNVKLNDGQDRYEGRVDIYDGHNWGSLCDNTISLNEAKVICSTATGYRDTIPDFYHLSNPEFHSSAFVVDTLTCAGWEDHISQCSFSKSGSCSVHFTHVKCFPDCLSVNNSKTGSIKSNNYPQPYEPNTDCLYIIQPPTGIYKIEFLDLQMADSGDYVEVKDKLHGRVMGHYTIFSGVKPIFGNQFYIRYKTNSQDESKGFRLQWSVADKADTVSVNCENSKWGAGVNLTSLRTILPEMSKANAIFINEPQCYGFIYDDLLLFQQLYNECDTNKTISNGYVTYTNRIVYIRNKVVQWEVPIECRKHQSSRIYHDHFSTNKRFVVTEDENEEFKFKTTFYYDWDKRLSEDVPFAFNQTYFYKIQLTDNDSDLTFELETCTLQQRKNGEVTLIKVVLNGQPVSRGVTVMTLSKDSKVIGINTNEDVDSHFTCDVKVTFNSTDK